MATKIESRILNALLDSYEKSRTFIGENKNQQTFKISVAKLFPRYDDDSDFAFYKEINTNLESLKAKELVTYKAERSGKIKTVFLEQDSIPASYKYIKRIPKADINSLLLKLWADYEKTDEIYSPLLKYIHEQKRHLKENKNVQFFDGELSEYKDILLAAKAILENQNEIFIREFSVKLFNNSKRLEAIESSVRSLLYNYGEYDDKETVFEEHNIIKTPTYVMLKGKGILNLGQKIDLEKIGGDIGLSTQSLRGLVSVELNEASVITIENLTSFHKYQPDNELAIYLGGFHNSVKRDFIKLVYKCNPKAKFKHFGDIDAGGFYILEHLKNKTGINFEPFNMDIETLEKNKAHWIALTANDRKRLCNLAEKFPYYKKTVEYMIKNNCKLEQEGEEQI